MRLTTRSIRTAQAIAAGTEFTTSGSLRGEAVGSWLFSGLLNAVESELLRSDLMGAGIDYAVISYSTPIAWRRRDGRWRVVAQTFSPTTSKHQSNLYLIERDEHAVEVVGSRGDWRVRCSTCGVDLRWFSLVGDAREFAHGHRFNHDHPAFSAV